MIDVILPAGGRISGDFARNAGAEIKALIHFGEQTMLERTIAMMRATDRISRIIVIGAPELTNHPAAREADAVLAEGDTGIDNLFHGIEWLRAQHGGTLPDRVLVAATDLPFLTADAVTSFLDACAPEAAICLPVIRREQFETRFPGSQNEYVSLRDGAWTIGCVFLLDPNAILANRPALDRVFKARKSQLSMARLLGPLFIARFITRTLTVNHIESRCAQIMGCSGNAVLGCPPELAYDIDQPDEYEYAMKSKVEG